MADCKYCFDEICVNADCPLRADYCPVPNDPNVCKWEDRDKIIFCKDCRYFKLLNSYGECSKTLLGVVSPDDYCSRGEKANNK